MPTVNLDSHLFIYYVQIAHCVSLAQKHFFRRSSCSSSQALPPAGAGYVLSREALRRFVEEGIPNPKKCRQDHAGSEDVEIGRSMRDGKQFFSVFNTFLSEFG